MHDAWLRQQRLEQPAARLAFDAAYETVLTASARRDRLDQASRQMAADSEFTPMVRRLGCLRGISTLTGFALAVEIGDWNRFTGNTIGVLCRAGAHRAVLGRIPLQGPITKAGNTHVRRLLIEAAWHHRTPTGPARPCAPGGTQATPQPASVATRATVGCTAAGSASTPARSEPIANTAIARELAGWCWSLATWS